MSTIGDAHDPSARYADDLAIADSAMGPRIRKTLQHLEHVIHRAGRIAAAGGD